MTELEMFKQAISEGLSQKFDEVVAATEEHPLDELWEKSVAEQEALLTPSTLTPGGDCLGDGCHDGYRCMCEAGCEHYLTCFPGADEEDEEETFYALLRYKCKRCGFTLERRYNQETDYGGGMVTCTCGAFGLDPHPLWPGITWRNDVDPHVDLEEYFETKPVNKPTA